MRIVKDPEERRQEILDAAEKLFSRTGFDGTSTNDILGAVGIARGTLYYHFPSKEDIMDALIGRTCTRVLDAARGIASDRSIPVLERILRVVGAMNIQGESGKEIMEHIHKPQNVRMHQKTQKVLLNGVAPILTEIVREGVEEGLFRTPYPREGVEMVVTYANAAFDNDLFDSTEEDRAARAAALLYNAERLFGAEPGSMSGLAGMFGDREGGDA